MANRYFQVDIAGDQMFAVKIREEWFDDYKHEETAVFAYCDEIWEDLNEVGIFIPQFGDGCEVEEIELSTYRDFDDKF